MDKKVTEELKYKMEEALKQITHKKDTTPTDIDHMTKILCALDMVKSIEEDESGGGEYSGRFYRRHRSYDGDSYRMHRDGGSNDGGSSGSRYRDSYEDGSMDGGSSERGYSGHDLRSMMMDKLDDMMATAHTDKERKMVREWMSYIDR